MSEISAYQGVNVVWFTSYLPRCSSLDERRDAVYLIRALKHLSHEGRGDLYRLNRFSRLDTKNVKQALEWFGTLAALVIRRQHFLPPVVLVPVPNSDCALNSFRPPRTVRLAEAIALKLPTMVAVSDGLRWKHQCRPSHLGGCRQADRLFRELELIRLPPSGTILLIDDVMTTGAHLLASTARLRSAGFQCENAICFGRTEWAEPRTFAIRHAIIL